MKKFLLALTLALSAIPALSDWVYADANVAVVARTTPCKGIVADLIANSGPPATLRWYTAEVQFEGRRIPACWAKLDGSILVIDAEGDSGVVPESEFRVLKEV